MLCGSSHPSCYVGRHIPHVVWVLCGWRTYCHLMYGFPVFSLRQGKPDQVNQFLILNPFLAGKGLIAASCHNFSGSHLSFVSIERSVFHIINVWDVSYRSKMGNLEKVKIQNTPRLTIEKLRSLPSCIYLYQQLYGELYCNVFFVC